VNPGHAYTHGRCVYNYISHTAAINANVTYPNTNPNPIANPNSNHSVQKLANKRNAPYFNWVIFLGGTTEQHVIIAGFGELAAVD